MKGCYFILTLLAFPFLTIAQKKNNTTYKWDEKKYAEKVLTKALKTDSVSKKQKSDFKLLQDSLQAVRVAEQTLFNIYGEETIKSERPYIISSIRDYWILHGTLHTDKGGCFIIVLDAYDGRVIYVTHEK